MFEIDNAVNKFEIWCEGYRISGNSSQAEFVGEFEAETFDEAVEEYNRTRDKSNTTAAERNTRERYPSNEAYEKRRSNWNIWACNLFNNEQDARKSFG